VRAPLGSPTRLVQQTAAARAAGGARNPEGDPPPDPQELRAAELLRVLQTPPPRLSPSARARIVGRLDESAARDLPAPRRALWPAALAAAVVLFAGGAVGAAWGLAPARRFLVRFLGAPSTTTMIAAPAPRRHAAAPALAPEEIAQEPAEENVAPAIEARIEPPVVELTSTVMDAPKDTRRNAPRRNAPRRNAQRWPVRLAHSQADGPRSVTRALEGTAPLTPPSEAPVVVESRLLAEALTDLRQRRDPQDALRVLDEYEHRFPSGALAPEASAARIDALLALGRRAQALQRLETLSLERLPRGTELRVLRGELRAGRGELGGAVDDFSAVLALTGAPTNVVERALYGRGSCRARLGDVAGARADLQEYLRRFPNGPFAEPARRALRD
jgi:tetratricopeptide (TPR) repeat protein